MSLSIGTRVKLVDWPFTSPGVYPIGAKGKVVKVLDGAGEGYFTVQLDAGNMPYCDGLLTARGDELEELPITSPDALEAASGAHRGDDGLAGVGAA